MTEIISVETFPALSETLKAQGKKIVLVGGCFDILHPGHVAFLERAKKAGQILIVILESDQKVKELKGVNRPGNTQKERAESLSKLSIAGYIVMLPYMKLESEYDELVGRIKPDVIAATEKDETLHHQRSAKLVGAKFQVVTKVVGNYSTTKILKSANEN